MRGGWRGGQGALAKAGSLGRGPGESESEEDAGPIQFLVPEAPGGGGDVCPTSKDSPDGETGGVGAASENPKRRTGKGPREPELVGVSARARRSGRRGGFMGLLGFVRTL